MCQQTCSGDRSSVGQQQYIHQCIADRRCMLFSHFAFCLSPLVRKVMPTSTACSTAVSGTHAASDFENNVV